MTNENKDVIPEKDDTSNIGNPFSTPDEAKEQAKEAGRPSIYTKDLAIEICKRLSIGETLRAICRDSSMPAMSTIMEWNIINKKEDSEDPDEEGFSEQYARAREMQVEIMRDEIIEISDDGTNDYMTITRGKEEYEVENKEVTSRSKLRVQTRQWLMSKVIPKKWGDKFDVTTDGEKVTGNVVKFVDFRGKKEDEDDDDN